MDECEDWQKALKVNHQKLRTGTIVENFLPELRSLFTDVEYSQVESKLGNVAHVDEVVRILLTKTGELFDEFCEILERNGYPLWAKRLRNAAGRPKVKADSEVIEGHLMAEKDCFYYPDIEAVDDEFYEKFLKGIDTFILESSESAFQCFRRSAERVIRHSRHVTGCKAQPSSNRAKFLKEIQGKYALWESCLEYRPLREVIMSCEDEGLMKQLQQYEKLLRAKGGTILYNCKKQKEMDSGLYLKLKAKHETTLATLMRMQEFLVKDVGLDDAIFTGFREGCIELYFRLPPDTASISMVPLRSDASLSKLHRLGVTRVELSEHWVLDAASGRINYLKTPQNDWLTEDSDYDTSADEVPQHKSIHPEESAQKTSHLKRPPLPKDIPHGKRTKPISEDDLLTTAASSEMAHSQCPPGNPETLQSDCLIENSDSNISADEATVIHDSGLQGVLRSITFHQPLRRRYWVMSYKERKQLKLEQKQLKLEQKQLEKWARMARLPKYQVMSYKERKQLKQLEQKYPDIMYTGELQLELYQLQLQLVQKVRLELEQLEQKAMTYKELMLELKQLVQEAMMLEVEQLEQKAMTYKELMLELKQLVQEAMMLEVEQLEQKAMLYKELMVDMEQLEQKAMLYKELMVDMEQLEQKNQFMMYKEWMQLDQLEQKLKQLEQKYEVMTYKEWMQLNQLAQKLKQLEQKLKQLEQKEMWARVPRLKSRAEVLDLQQKLKLKLNAMVSARSRATSHSQGTSSGVQWKRRTMSSSSQPLGLGEMQDQADGENTATSHSKGTSSGVRWKRRTMSSTSELLVLGGMQDQADGENTGEAVFAHLPLATQDETICEAMCSTRAGVTDAPDASAKHNISSCNCELLQKCLTDDNRPDSNHPEVLPMSGDQESAELIEADDAEDEPMQLLREQGNEHPSTVCLEHSTAGSVDSLQPSLSDLDGLPKAKASISRRDNFQ